MNQLKNNIIDKINGLDDINVINALNSILDNIKAPAVQKLQTGEKELVLLGLEDYKKGNLIDDAELRKEEDKWLNE
ncbi:hypothetical protein [Pontibacter russatus]|uniref:hypothetical protein n=1 Tax=Pontibacter russatus TaxID=2694929 RepID=UPI00137B5451|nr:hypothetical protein [Pontibacter russatus]